MCARVCDCERRKGCVCKRKNEWKIERREREGEKVLSLGAGRPMWLRLPLFVFPTQSDMTGAISTPSHSHSQGPLSANIPLLMIHRSVKGTMFAYGTASCTWHHYAASFCAQNISAIASFYSDSQNMEEIKMIFFLTFLGWYFSLCALYFSLIDVLSIMLPIMHVNVWLHLCSISCLQPVQREGLWELSDNIFS